MPKPIKLRLREAFYLRKSALDTTTQRLLKKKYSFYFFEEKACADCEELTFRQNEETGAICERCKECAAFLGGAELCKNVKVGKHYYLTVPSGDGVDLYKFLKQRGYDVHAISLAKHRPIDPIGFTGQLRDYQEEAIQAMLKKRRGVVCLPPRSGKCVASGTMVMTSVGLLPIEKLFESHTLDPEKESIFSTNIKVATYEGSRDVSHLYTKVVDNTIRIKTESGYTLQGTPNHPVMVLTDDFDFEWKPMGEITKSDILVMARRTQWLPKGTPRFDLLPTYKVSKGDSSVSQIMPTQMSEELAELLGFWVANGCLSTNLAMSSHNSRVRNRFVECCSIVFPKSTTRIIVEDGKEVGVAVSMGSKQIYKFLEETVGLSMGVAKDKFIPEVLLRGDKKYLTAFLRAYISCDSYITTEDITLCTASEKLVYQLQEILPYYGVRSRMVVRKSCATNGTGIYKKYYCLVIGSSQAQTLIKELEYLYKEYYKGPFKQSYCTARALEGIDDALIKEFGTKSYDKWVKVTKNPDIFYNKVTSIESITTPTRVYDICVPEGHHFIANTFVSHNTLIGSAFICRVQQKAMVLASQREWLLGFKETFIGSATQQGFTDLDPSRIGLCKNLADFDKYDVCLVTVQTLRSELGEALLNKIKDYFGCVVIDEVHGGAAPKYIQVLSKLNCKYKIGLSGTPDRKDGRYVLVRHVVGPIVYEKKVKQLVPKVELTRTQFSRKMPARQGVWAYVVGPLEKDKERQKLIAKKALEDVKKGHMVLITYSTVKAIQSQVEIINKMAGSEMAKAFYGGLKKKDRDQIVEDARTYKLKIIVGNIRLLSTGLNIPRASSLIDGSITANMPNAKQRYARILTAWEDKPEPVIHLLLDDYDVKRNCLKAEFWQALWPYFHPKISPSDLQLLKDYFANRQQFRVTLGHSKYNYWD